MRPADRAALLAHCDRLLAAPMHDSVLWRLLDSMAHLAPLDASHRRSCAWCGQTFYVERESVPNRFCSCRCSRRSALFMAA